MWSKILLLSIMLTCKRTLFSQIIEVNSILKTNEVTPYQNQKLILIDFWATWCAPCIPATRQLEILQELAKDKVYMVSLSDETDYTIQKFLEKKKIKLMVVSDHKYKLVHQYKINSRPYCVLLSFDGKLLWEGKPSDLNVKLIEKYESKVKKNNKEELQSIIKETEKDTVNYKENPEKTIENISEIKASIIDEKQQINSLNEEQYTFQGELKKLISDLLQISELNIETTYYSDILVKVDIPLYIYNNSSKLSLLDSILNKLNLQLENFDQKNRVKEIIIKKKKKLWDTTQINWGENSPKLLIGNDRIQADNISIKEMAIVLSDTKNMLYIYNGIDESLYDWDFHYLYDQFMYEELETSFGIEVKDIVNENIHYFIDIKK